MVESGDGGHNAVGSTTTTGHAVSAATFQGLIEATLKADIPSGDAVRSGPGGAMQLTRDDIILTKMHADTKEVMATPDFSSLLNLCLKIGFMRIGEQLNEHFGAATPVTPVVPIEPVENGKIVPKLPPKVPLAKIIPWVSSMVNSVCATPPNLFIQELLLLEPLKQFSCNVYDAFSQEGKF